MSLTTIENKFLNVKIESLGAEIKSISKSDTEFIWKGDKAYWTGSAPVLFPICGGLKNDKYIYEGKEYIMSKHGFAKKMDFTIFKLNKNKVVFLLTQNSETLKIYPFNFEFYITYSLNKNSLKVEYKVKNTGDNTMYYSVGAHEAYACPEGIDKYSVKFEKSESFYSNVLNGNLLEENKILIAENTDTIKLNYDYFKVDALVFKTLESKKVILQNDSGRKIILDYKGFPYFLLWTKPNAPYICLEPWRGIPDGMNPSGNLTEKEGIIKLEKGKTDKSIHKITFQI